MRLRHSCSLLFSFAFAAYPKNGARPVRAAGFHPKSTTGNRSPPDSPHRWTRVDAETGSLLWEQLPTPPSRGGSSDALESWGSWSEVSETSPSRGALRADPASPGAASSAGESPDGKKVAAVPREPERPRNGGDEWTTTTDEHGKVIAVRRPSGGEAQLDGGPAAARRKSFGDMVTDAFKGFLSSSDDDGDDGRDDGGEVDADEGSGEGNFPRAAGEQEQPRRRKSILETLEEKASEVKEEIAEQQEEIGKKFEGFSEAMRSVFLSESSGSEPDAGAGEKRRKRKNKTRRKSSPRGDEVVVAGVAEEEEKTGVHDQRPDTRDSKCEGAPSPPLSPNALRDLR